MSIKSLLLSTTAVIALTCGAAWAAGPTATIEDAGSNNKAAIDQTLATHSSSQATINQASGTSQNVAGDPGTPPGTPTFGITQVGSGTMTALIDQLAGPGNDAWIKQNDTGGTSTAGISQSSTTTGNIADITQNGAGNVAGDGVTTYGIIQLGDENEAHIDQGDTTATTSSTASISQEGNLNIANISDQGGVSNQSSIAQTGDSNQAKITQDTAQGIAAVISQADGTNFASIEQKNGASSSHNTAVDPAAKITQTGGGNGLALNDVMIVQDGVSGATKAEITQDGSETHAVITQKGVSQTASIDQTGAGSSNTADITQNASADNAEATIKQGLGGTNTAEIIQSAAGVEGTIEQNLTAGTGTNAAKISQTVVANAVATIKQSGSGGNALIVQ